MPRNEPIDQAEETRTDKGRLTVPNLNERRRLISKVSTKLHKLYSTNLPSHVFMEEEMGEGAVEPDEYRKKIALDQEKVNLIKSKLLKYIYQNNLTVK